MFYHGALDEHLQCNTSYGSVKPHNDPRGLDRIPDRLCVRDVPGLVCGLRTGEGLRVPFSCKAGESGASQGDRGFLFHGGSDGDYHVPLRCPRGMCKGRKLRPSADHLAHEYPKEFCNGTAVPAHHRRTARPQGVPWRISGRDCVSVKNSEKKAAVQIAA